MLWEPDPQPPPRVGWLEAEEMVAREAWPAECAEELAFQRLRMERRGLTEWELRLRAEKAEFAADRRAFYVVAGVWTAILLLGSLLAAWTQGGAW
jgi:hypothetical protein